MKMRDKNHEVRSLIEDMERKGADSGHSLLKSLAASLNRPRRIMSEVSLNAIERHAAENESVAVAGSVLGIGEIKKPVNVAALRFSSSARKKIEDAGGRCMTLRELMEKPPKRVRILG